MSQPEPDPRPDDRDGPRRIGLNGIQATIPLGWEARIRLGADLGAARAFPVLHAATVPLPRNRADYGGGVVERLGTSDVFVTLIEFGDEAAGTALYPEVDEIPLVSPDDFHPAQLNRSIPGQAGTQTFFTYEGRAFCLYVVLGSYGRRIALAAEANRIIADLAIVAR